MAFSGRKISEFRVVQSLSHNSYAMAIMSKKHWIYKKIWSAWRKTWTQRSGHKKEGNSKRWGATV